MGPKVLGRLAASTWKGPGGPGPSEKDLRICRISPVFAYFLPIFAYSGGRKGQPFPVTPAARHHPWVPAPHTCPTRSLWGPMLHHLRAGLGVPNPGTRTMGKAGPQPNPLGISFGKGPEQEPGSNWTSAMTLSIALKSAIPYPGSLTLTTPPNSPS